MSSNTSSVKYMTRKKNQLAYRFYRFVILSSYAPQSSNPRGQQHLSFIGCLWEHFTILVVYFLWEAPCHLHFLTSESKSSYHKHWTKPQPTECNGSSFSFTKARSIGLLSSEFLLIFLKTRSIQWLADYTAFARKFYKKNGLSNCNFAKNRVKIASNVGLLSPRHSNILPQPRWKASKSIWIFVNTEMHRKGWYRGSMKFQNRENRYF